MRLIDAYKAVAYIEQIKSENKKLNRLLSADEDEIIKFLKEKCDTVDAVSVVRCEDCRSFMKYSDTHNPIVEGAAGDCFLRLSHSECQQFFAVKETDYCSDARKIDEDAT